MLGNVDGKMHWKAIMNPVVFAVHWESIDNPIAFARKVRRSFYCLLGLIMSNKEGYKSLCAEQLISFLI